jgi:hypothetical protein
MVHIHTPHIALGSSMEDALEILGCLGHVRQEDSERESRYRVETPIFAIAVYPKSGTVGSVWDGRSDGKELKGGTFQEG